MLNIAFYANIEMYLVRSSYTEMPYVTKLSINWKQELTFFKYLKASKQSHGENTGHPCKTALKQQERKGLSKVSDAKCDRKINKKIKFLTALTGFITICHSGVEHTLVIKLPSSHVFSSSAHILITDAQLNNCVPKVQSDSCSSFISIFSRCFYNPPCI